MYFVFTQIDQHQQERTAHLQEIQQLKLQLQKQQQLNHLLQQQLQTTLSQLQSQQPSSPQQQAQPQDTVTPTTPTAPKTMPEKTATAEKSTSAPTSEQAEEPITDKPPARPPPSPLAQISSTNQFTEQQQLDSKDTHDVDNNSFNPNSNNNNNNSSSNNDMSEAERERLLTLSALVKEIVDTERDYVADLEIVREVCNFFPHLSQLYDNNGHVCMSDFANIFFVVVL